MVSADGLSKFPAVKWCSQTVWANSPLWNGVRTQFEQILSCEMVSADGLSKFPTVKWCPQTVWANSQLWNDVRRRFKSSWSSRVLAWRSTCSPIRLFFGLLHCVRNDGQVILDCFTAFARTSEWKGSDFFIIRHPQGKRHTYTERRLSSGIYLPRREEVY